MSGMNASITISLIDQVSAPAKQIKAALEDITKAAGNSVKDAGKAANAKVEAATKAAKDQAKASAEAPAKAAAEKARETTKRAAETAKPRQMVPKNPVQDFLRAEGISAPKATNATPDVPEPAKPRKGKLGKAVGFASFGGDLDAEAGALGLKSGGIAGRAIQDARKQVARAVGQELAGRVSDLATAAVTERLQEALAPARAAIEQLRLDFPALAPVIDQLSGNFEMIASSATLFAGETIGRVGAMAAGLISLPGLAIIGTVAIMARWSQVKAFFDGLFQRLPQPVQAAMTRIGAVLAATPLGALARGFDGIGSYVEKVFQTINSTAEDKWDQLRQLLVQNPLDWMRGAWDGLKDFLSSFWQNIRTNPGAVLAGIVNPVVAMIRSIPQRLAGLAFDIAEAVTGFDLSAARGRVDAFIAEMMAIPGRIAAVAGEIIAKLVEGDWTGAATMAVDAYLSAFRNILSGIATLANDIVLHFTGIDLSSAGQQIVNSLLAGLQSAWSNISKWLSDRADDIKKRFSNMMPSWGGGSTPGGGGSSVPRRARGGPVSAGGVYLVGEEGQELFVPDQDGAIIDAGRTRRALAPVSMPAASAPPRLYGGSGEEGGVGRSAGTGGGSSRNSSTTNNFSISIAGAPSDDPETFARRLNDELARQARGLLHDGGGP